MSGPLREALERIVALDMTSPFDVVTAGGRAKEIAREALAIEPEYEYRAMWDGEQQWPARGSLGAATHDLAKLRGRYRSPDHGHVERRTAGRVVPVGEWEQIA